MSATVADIQAKIIARLTESVDGALVLDAINDSIVDIWEAMMISNLSSFLGGKVTATFAQASDVLSLVSVLDPSVAPTVSGIVSGALPLHNLAVTYTLVTDSGSQTLPSPVSNIAVPANSVAQVTSPARVAGTVGWNVFFNGIQQNDAPISWGVPFIEDDQNGAALDGPDVPTVNGTGDDIWYIKELWVNTPDNGEKAWDQTEIGGSLWRAMANSGVAAQTPYQPYVYDLTSGTGGNQIQVRPIPQAATTINYVLVSRPRQLKYPNSVLPFNHPSAEPYIKENSLALILLSQREFEAHREWKALATDRLMKLTVTNYAKRSKANMTITPFIR